MLPSPQGYTSNSAALAGYSLANFSYPNQQNILSQPLQDHSLHQGTDPNSLEVFRQNLQLVQDHVVRLQSLARSAAAGIQNAYHHGNSPGQTDASIATLKQMLSSLADLMRNTGVGALPLLPSQGSEPLAVPTEEQMMADTPRAVQELYEKLRRSQDSAAVVANLLTAPERVGR